MTTLIALAVGLAAGVHTATWGMYKDAIHEGFTVRRFARSIVLGGALAPLLAAVAGIDVRSAGGLVLLFGLTYAVERAVSEFYKTFVREEDQTKYTIPMQFHVLGTVVQARGTRLAVGAAYATAGVLIFLAVARLQALPPTLPPWLAVLLVGSIGGWVSAVGGAWKDAPIEGFETLKFFRSPAMAGGYALLTAQLTESWPVMALAALGFTIATIETYKTFFFPSKPRGKFAGKPVLFPAMLVARRRFVPVYVAIWLAVLAGAAAALAEARP